MAVLGRLTATTLLVCVLTIAAGLFAERAWACTCLAQTDDERFARASAVFTGIADTMEAGDPRVWTFAVESVERGNVGRVAEVRVPAYTQDCNFDFVVGSRYQVFVFDVEARAYTDHCTGTRQLAAGQDPIPAPTGEPTVNPRNPPPPPPTSGPPRPTTAPSTPDDNTPGDSGDAQDRPPPDPDDRPDDLSNRDDPTNPRQQQSDTGEESDTADGIDGVDNVIARGEQPPDESRPLASPGLWLAAAAAAAAGGIILLARRRLR